MSQEPEFTVKKVKKAAGGGGFETVKDVTLQAKTETKIKEPVQEKPQEEQKVEQ